MYTTSKSSEALLWTQGVILFQRLARLEVEVVAEHIARHIEKLKGEVIAEHQGQQQQWRKQDNFNAAPIAT